MNIYLDHAASTPIDPDVLERMNAVNLAMPGNPSSTHKHGRTLKAELEKNRRILADLLGAAPSEIYFTSGGTESDNIAIRGGVSANDIRHVISSPIEHHAVTHSIEHLEKEGKVSVNWLQPDEKGNIKMGELSRALSDKPASLVSLMHGNNEIGTLLDLDAVSELCKESGSLFHSDTVQTVANYKFNLSEQHIHFIAASAHKFNGPKGIGFLYIKQGTRVDPILVGGGHERSMRPGTENVAAIAGMVMALGNSLGKGKEKTGYIRSIKHYMMDLLSEKIPGVDFNGETEPDHSMPNVLNVAFPFGDKDSMLVFNLDIAGVSVSGGSACGSGASIGSHVLAGIGCKPGRAINSIRFSFGMTNTKEEIDEVVSFLSRQL